MQESRPTYQNALRVIGRYFDDHLYRNILVSEVADGFIARAFPQQDVALTHAEGLQFLLDDVMTLIARSKELAGQRTQRAVTSMPPLCPTGYEDFLRALGWEMDRANVRLIGVVEMTHGVLVSYYRPDRATRSGGHWQQTFYDEDGITALLNKGFSRRALGAAARS